METVIEPSDEAKLRTQTQAAHNFEHKIKGENRLAIVTDCNRALDMPDGEYIFGPKQNGQSFLHRDQVGLTLDGKSLASSSTGMDHHVRTFYQLTGLPLETVIKMASLNISINLC